MGNQSKKSTDIIDKAVEIWLSYEDTDKYNEDKAREVIAARLVIKRALSEGYKLVKPSEREGSI